MAQISKAAKAAARKSTRDVAGAMKLFDGLMSEKKPKVSAEAIARIEDDFRTFGGALNVNRRIALMYLSRTFSETAKKIREDRDTAVQFAAASGAIESSIKKYSMVLDLLTTAQTRLMIALCQRTDMQEVVTEGEASLVEKADYSAALLAIPTAPQTH